MRKWIVPNSAIVSLSALVAAVTLFGCGTKAPGVGPGSNPVAPAPTPAGTNSRSLGKDFEIVSSSKMMQRGTNGSLGNVSAGSPSSQINVQTKNGYKVYLSVMGQ